MAVRMAGLAFGGGAEHGGDVVVAFDIGLLREIEIAAVGLAFAGKRVLQILCGLGIFECGHGLSPLRDTGSTAPEPRGTMRPAVKAVNRLELF